MSRVSRVASQAPVAASQILRVSSSLAETRRRPSGEKAQPLTALSCPLRVASQAPVSASHSLRVLSSLAETRRRPSGEKAQELTGPPCPSRVAWQLPVSASQSLRVLSLPSRSTEVYLYPVSYTHLRAHETDSYLVCRLLLEK